MQKIEISRWLLGLSEHHLWHSRILMFLILMHWHPQSSFYVTSGTLSFKFLTQALLHSGTHLGGFQFLLILDLWGISFHAVVVFGLGKNLLFKSVRGHCEIHMQCLTS